MFCLRVFQRIARLSVLTVFLLSYVFFSGCASLSKVRSRIMPQHWREQKSSAQPLAIDIFVARNFLGGPDYERYQLRGNTLWSECGSIDVRSKKTGMTAKELPSRDVFPYDPNLVIKEKGQDDITNAKSIALKKEAAVLIQVLDEARERMPSPGTLASLSDSGIFQLSFEFAGEKKKLITSVDAVADGDSPVLKQVKKLFTALRPVGVKICGEKTFFGIGG